MVVLFLAQNIEKKQSSFYKTALLKNKIITIFVKLVHKSFVSWNKKSSLEYTFKESERVNNPARWPKVLSHRVYMPIRPVFSCAPRCVCSVKFDATTSDVILNVWFIQQTTLYLCRLYCTNHCDIVFPTKLPVTATGDFAKCKLRPMLKVRGQLDLSSFRGRWMSSKLQLDVCDHNQCSAIWWTLTRWRQAWCFEVKMCDPCRRRFTTAL